MFEGFSDKTIDFMWNIRMNNNREWFNEHKEEYLNDFYQPMKELSRLLFDKIEKSYGGRGFIHKTSRIYRDARRLHGAPGPYKDRLWISIEKPSEMWTSSPTFWFELSPEEWSYGLGYYMATAETMAKFRECIDKDCRAFEKLIAPLDKQTEFVLEGPEYARKKTAPSEKVEAWYNKKTFSLIHNQKNGEELFSPDLADKLFAGYKFLMPFYDFFISVNPPANPK